MIDGDPSDWESASWTELFVDIEGDAKPPPRLKTRAKMGWDEHCLYVAAELEEPNVWGTLTARDSVLHHQNNFEVFIDPDADGARYHELQVNALNTVFDLLLVRRYRDGGPARIDWNMPGVRTAVHVDGTVNDPSDVDRGWSVEIAIPWKDLTARGGASTADVPCPPEVGDQWRVNFSRVEWRLETVEGVSHKVEAKAGEPRIRESNWVWSPQRVIDMHEPVFWGIVEFADKPTAEPVDKPAEVVIDDETRVRWLLRAVDRIWTRSPQADHAALWQDLTKRYPMPEGWAWALPRGMPGAYLNDARAGGRLGGVCQDGRVLSITDDGRLAASRLDAPAPTPQAELDATRNP